MPAINEADLKKQIKSGEFSNLYLFYGEEKYLIKHYTGLIVKKAVPDDFAEFNFHTYDGKDTDIDEVSVAAEALPMFSSYRCILIKDFPIDSINADTSDKLVSLINDIPETTIIVFSMLNIDINSKNSKGKKIVSEFLKFGTVAEFEHASVSQLAKLIEKGAAQRNCEMQYSEISYLVSLVGDDMTVLLNELEKICAYKKEGKITKADIDSVVVKNVQARAFDLAKALVAKNCDTAMDILNALFAMKEEPVSILGAIATPYVDMYRAKVYISGGMRAEDAAKDFNYRNKEFRLTNAARSISGYSVLQLRSFLDILNDADTALKTTSFDPKLVLEKAITEILLVSNGEKL
jgi:DNA polymerase-3 subunit delta